MREGVELEGGELLDLDSDVIGHADHTFVIDDSNLLRRLREQHPALDAMPNVTVVIDIAELLTDILIVEDENKPR